jgi:ribA/ribD-fused uncharacterized protein
MFEDRAFVRAESATFKKTDERYGGLSNMCGGYPVFVNKTRILTTEHLYQISRFPENPEIQREILGTKSPMGAKMVAKHHKAKSREDWEDQEGLGVRVEVMRWCLKLKLAQNYENFRSLLLATKSMPIVEESHNDSFWGARPMKTDTGVLFGKNALGHLLMEIRERLGSESEDQLKVVPVPAIPNFRIFGNPVIGKG